MRFLTGVGALILLATSPAPAQKRYILRAAPEAIESIARQSGLTVVSRGGRDLSLVVDPAGRLPAQLVVAVRSQPLVANFELDAVFTLPEREARLDLNQSTVAILDGLTNRSLTAYYGDAVWAGYLSQPATAIIRLREAQAAYATGLGTVAIIDTGVDPSHPVLRNALAPGYDFVRDIPGFASELADLDQSTVAILDGSRTSIVNKTPFAVNQSTVAILDQSTVAILDRNKLPAAFGHGTMVAGLVRLAAPTARIMPLKAFRADGTGALYDVIRAIEFAVDNGAAVINMSFSMTQPSRELEAAISRANARRVICVSSAGNAGIQAVVYPAAYKKVEGVASTSNSDVRSGFSNYGDALVSVAAPGEGLLTSYPFNNYAAASGTSFSAALVSGGVALLNQIDPNSNISQADSALAKAQPVGPGMGAGRIDLYRACDYMRRGR